jgi:hypothetical protein
VSFEAPDGQAWRGFAELDPTSGTIDFSGESVSSIADCKRGGVSKLTGVIPVVPEESFVGAEGALRIQFDDPKAEPSWFDGRPEIHIDHARTFAAHSMELEITPDGVMTAVLKVTDIGFSDGGSRSATPGRSESRGR